MDKDYFSFLKQRLNKESFDKVNDLGNFKVINFIGEYVELCNPETVFICTDSAGDSSHIREKAKILGEEKSLGIAGHTIHFDSPLDQARDKKNTKYFISKGSKEQNYLNGVDRDQGTKEIRDILKDIMKGKEMFVCFFCLGPIDSDFSILAVQITDSAYVAHSEDILYRPGYEQLKKAKEQGEFFSFVHSAGELEDNLSKNVDKRRVYMDLENNLVYSVNTQYAGNTVGLKKLSLRLAIQKAYQEGWLAEHMFVMNVADKDGKKAYFCGAYPSMCGKTSTAMLEGESIVGDDIAYLRARNGKAYAVNVERGIFGIVKDVNPKDDPVLFESLTKEGEVIFSNILIDKEGGVFWIGKCKDIPHRGINYTGDWEPGKTDNQGEEVPPSHKNARYTIRLKDLKNVDDNLENPEGVEVKGLIYGGRDSDTSVPVEQALSWQQGIITKAASLESETTAATLGKEGVRVFNPMANMDFLSISVGKYIESNLKFSEKLTNQPLIFSVNYFLRDNNGGFLNGIKDKQVWLKWMRLRSEDKVKALRGPTGLLPEYDDLKKLFKEVLNKDYSEVNYVDQFTIRILENLAKIERIKNIYKKLEGIPECLFTELDAQVSRLREAQKKNGNYINPKNLSAEALRR
ncbi:MAG: phosphoenolpyruvate carboxykinase (GTP) [Candidatus Susulua stagnicola]|nr:phosphoenolpyruvate carboxykinase (GTP) [Candidatus Susulua stagnicola]